MAYVTSSGRDWRKVPESDARSVDAGIKIVKQLERNQLWQRAGGRV